MPDNAYIALLVVVSAAVTWALRALPFAALAPMRDSTWSSTSASICLSG